MIYYVYKLIPKYQNIEFKIRSFADVDRAINSQMVYFQASIVDSESGKRDEDIQRLQAEIKRLTEDNTKLKVTQVPLSGLSLGPSCPCIGGFLMWIVCFIYMYIGPIWSSI